MMTGSRKSHWKYKTELSSPAAVVTLLWLAYHHSFATEALVKVTNRPRELQGELAASLSRILGSDYGNIPLFT